MNLIDKTVLTVACSAFIPLCSVAQRPVLKYNRDGAFKIVQFTDLHFKKNVAASNAALECINTILDKESPDLVIFTGDLIYAPPADEALLAVLDPVISRKIPYAVTWGNHDDEQGMNRSDLQKIVESQPYNCGFTAEGVTGKSNFVLRVESSRSDKIENILYCFDSNAYASDPNVKGYDWIKADQIAWYRSQNAYFKDLNGDKPIPALAFYHIPVPEFSIAAKDESAKLLGYRMERSCPPNLNSGLFTAMFQGGDVMGHFVGHDHDNDYAVYWKGVLLAYGRFSGGKTEYYNLPVTNGARVIQLQEGKRDFKTYIRQTDGKVMHEINYPGDFKKK